jgi:nucleoside-triphosphatase THEP1
MRAKTRITVITGSIGAGKTTRANSYRKQAERAAGILAFGVFERGAKTGYEAQSITTGERRRLLCTHQDGGFLPVGKYFMDPEVFKWANNEILCGTDAPMIVIDELGPLELEKQGYYDAANTLVRTYSGELVLVLRSNLVERMLHLLGLDFNRIHIIPVTGKERV